MVAPGTRRLPGERGKGKGKAKAREPAVEPPAADSPDSRRKRPRVTAKSRALSTPRRTATRSVRSPNVTRTAPKAPTPSGPVDAPTPGVTPPSMSTLNVDAPAPVLPAPVPDSADGAISLSAGEDLSVDLSDDDVHFDFHSGSESAGPPCSPYEEVSPTPSVSGPDGALAAWTATVDQFITSSYNFPSIATLVKARKDVLSAHANANDHLTRATAARNTANACQVKVNQLTAQLETARAALADANTARLSAERASSGAAADLARAESRLVSAADVVEKSAYGPGASALGLIPL